MGVNKEKRVCINFYLENSFLKRIETIVKDSSNIFDDKSTLIRYCVKQMLPIIEMDLKKDKEKMTEQREEQP